MKNYIKQKLKQLNFSKITPIQKELFSKFEHPFHLVGIAPTGTGKTHAYLLPILSRINWQQNKIQAVIVVPTNELVFQIMSMLKNIETQNAKVKIFYGGMNKQKISLYLAKKQPVIIIATLSKLLEYAHDLKQLNIFQSKYLVLDEADMLFEQKSLKLLDILLVKWNPKILLFSASITINMKPFINKYFGQSLFLDVNDKEKLKIKYHLLESAPENRLNDLKHFLKCLNPYLALIFVSSKKEQNKIYEFLKKDSFPILNFSSDLPVQKRKQYINEIKKMKHQYILVSDVASRGLDLDVSWVIHYDLPIKNIEFFQHRSGRTGRMGKEGDVLVFYNAKDQVFLNKISKMHNIDFQKIILTKDNFIAAPVKLTSSKIKNMNLDSQKYVSYNSKKKFRDNKNNILNYKKRKNKK